MLKTDLRRFTKHFAEYTELRAQENRSTRIILVNGALMGNATSATSGVSARVNNNGNWGFASDPVISDAAIEKVIVAAKENAAFLAAKKSKGQQELPSHPHSCSINRLQVRSSALWISLIHTMGIYALCLCILTMKASKPRTRR